MRSARLILLFTLALPLSAAVTPSKAELHAWLDEGLQAAAKVPEEHRRALAYSLPTAHTRDDRFKLALLKIALRPGGNGWYDFVGAAKSVPGTTIPTQRDYDERVQAALEFLDGIYRARAGMDTPIARQWQSGLAEMLFCTGKFDEALRLQREVADREPEAYRVILLAIMEKAAGNDEPFAKIKAECPKPAFDYEGTGPQYCSAVIRSIAHRTMGSLPVDRVPAAIRAMLTDGTVDWRERMHGFEILREYAAAGVREQLEAILASSDAPAWAKDDALFALVRQAMTADDWPRAASLMDCWFRRTGITFERATAETWQKVAAMPYDPEKEVRVLPDCYRHHDPDEPASRSCVLYGLMVRFFGAGNDPAGRRAALDELAPYVVRNGTGLKLLSDFLSNLGKGRDARVLQYNATMQTPALFPEDTSAAVRTQSARSAPLTPWDPEQAKDANRSSNCPP